jgi:hypothetical protein
MTEPIIKLEKSNKLSINYFIPSYMRNAGIMHQIKLKVESLSWEYEGKLVYIK